MPVDVNRGGNTESNESHLLRSVNKPIVEPIVPSKRLLLESRSVFITCERTYGKFGNKKEEGDHETGSAC